MKARLIVIRPETENIISFLFEPDRRVNRKSGQFIRYTLPLADNDSKGNGRYFTVASAPYEEILQITTRFSDPSSSFKKALKQLAIGAEIQFDEPEGEFIIKDFEKNYIFVVGGIGITPVRSILAQADHDNVFINAKILYATKDQTILFKQQLANFCEKNRNLSVTYTVNPEQELEALLSDAICSTENPYVYITGPEPMVEQFTVLTKKLGIDIHHIQTDFFDGYKSIS